MDINRLVDDIIVARYVKTGEMLAAGDISAAISPRPTASPAQRVWRMRTGALVLTSDVIASLCNFSGLSPSYFLDAPDRPSFDDELLRIIQTKK